MTTIKAVLYTRVSSDEQKKKGFSLDYQEKQGREYAERNNLQIIKIFTESFTAKKPGRPMFNEMISFVRKHKVQHLIFLKSDRASRNGVDSAALVYMAERESFNIHLIQDGLCLNRNSRPTDFLIFEMNNVFANFYPRNLSIEVTTKLLEKAEQGFYPVRSPIGYQRKPKLKKAYLQIDIEKAPFIKRIFELYSTGEYSYSSLAEKMREEGFMVSPAVKCGKSNIEDILNNPIYMGDFVYKGKRYFNAKHEPIVSRELYAICQNIIQSRIKGKPSKHDFIFSNLIKCSKCGCYMVGELKKGKYIYYHCTGNKGGDCKKTSYVREEKIEKAILETLETIRLSDDVLELAKRCFKNELENQNLYNEERLNSIDEEIKKLKSRSDKLFNLYLDGKVADDIYTKKAAEIESNLDELILSRSAMTKTGFELLKYSENLFELFKMTTDIYLRLSNSKKRELLKMLCSNFLYDGENIRITIKKAFQPLVEIAKLEKMGLKRQCSNFLQCIKTLINTMQQPENLLILEQITNFKNELLAA
jgi:DNA invertase Pin-like site-specific DNA recombinase